MLPQLSAATICCGLTVSSDTRTVSSCILTVSSQASSRAYLAISSLTVVLACSNFCLTVKDYQDERDAKLNKFVLLCLCTTSVSRCASTSVSPSALSHAVPLHCLCLCLCYLYLNFALPVPLHCLCLTLTVSVSASVSLHCLCLTPCLNLALSHAVPLSRPLHCLICSACVFPITLRDAKLNKFVQLCLGHDGCCCAAVCGFWEC